jgi:class 3 adenylate cyclase
MWRFKSNRYSVTLFGLLVTCFGLLTITSTALVLAISHDDATSNTRELLRQKSEVITQAIVERVTAHRQSSEALAAHLAGILAEKSNLSLKNAEVSTLLSASLSATPHVSTIGLIDSQFRMLRVFRKPRPELHSLVDWSDDPGFVRMVREGTSNQRPSWGELFYSEFSRTTFVNYLHPLKGTSHLLLLSISINDLSDYLRRMEKDIVGNSFILFDRNFVLAHPKLISGYAGLDDRHPLPSLEGFSDRTLSAIWSAKNLPKVEAWFAGSLKARVVEIGGSPFVFLFRNLPGYGSARLLVGTYYSLDDVAPQIERNRNMLYLGGGLIVLTLLMALVLSRMISLPIKKFTSAAEQISKLHLDQQLDMPDSRISEVREANQALHTMVSGLRSFERYVPEKLVHRVMEESESGDIVAEEKTISVLFTDIVGFTGLAEAMSAADVLTMLNEHFELIDACIEAEAGTIDKYMGDSVMAFWGGLETDENHAIHACAAALRIETAIGTYNDRRMAGGQKPLHVRIGIHTGPVMIGNIGAAARISYTVIGDTVNIAARLEEFAREVSDQTPQTLTVISGETASRIGSGFGLQNVGQITLRGRHETTDVFKLSQDNREPRSIKLVS